MSQNDAGTGGEIRHESDTVSFADVPDLHMENPGARAGATGAESIDLADKTPYRKPRFNAMSAFAQDRHKRAARVLGYALTDPALEMWISTGYVWSVRLTPLELACIAFTALSQMEPEARVQTFNAAHWGRVDA